MKNNKFRLRTILVYLAVFYAIAACNPDALISTGGRAGATINGKPWIADYIRCQANTPCYGNRFGLNVSRQLPSTNVESLSFHNVPARMGTYKVYASGNLSPCGKDTVSSAFYTLIGGDVSGERFLPLDGAENLLYITKYNEKTGEIRGIFSVTYVISDRRYQNYPDTLRVTDSQFQTIIVR